MAFVAFAVAAAACNDSGHPKPKLAQCVAQGAAGAAGEGGLGGEGSYEPSRRLPLLVTSSEGHYWVSGGALEEVATKPATVTVDEGSTGQTWRGFSGAFNEMGWDYLSLLGEADRERALQLLFGKEGCRFAMGRIPIGASDYAMDRYTLDEVESGSDPGVASFSIERDQDKLIPFIQAAQDVKSDLRFWASPWTPPTWMKEGPFNDESPFDGGSMKGDASTLRAFAEYFVKFVQAYAEQGIDIELVSPQNEPGYSGTYPTCAWEPETYRDFVGRYLGPALAEAGLNTGVMLGTFNGGPGDTDIVSATMGAERARRYVTVLGCQWGMLNNVESAKQYGVELWQTEHKCGNYPWLDGFVEGTAPNDHAYAVESWGLLRNWIQAGVTSYATWNMVLDKNGLSIDLEREWPQNALLTVDTSTGTLNVTPAYYVFRHLAQFVDPGATVLGTRGGDALAFRNPDCSIVSVIYNPGGATDYVLSVRGKRLEFRVPENGWATVVL